MAFQMNASGTVQEGHWLVHLTILFKHCFRLSYFPASWKDVKVINSPKTGYDPKFTSDQPLVHYGQSI